MGGEWEKPSRQDYKAALDCAVVECPWADKAVVRRLEADLEKDGRGVLESALIRLRMPANHAVPFIFNLIQSATVALHQDWIRKHSTSIAEKLRKQAKTIDDLLQLHDAKGNPIAEGNPIDPLKDPLLLPLASRIALAQIRDERLALAANYQAMPDRLIGAHKLEYGFIRGFLNRLNRRTLDHLALKRLTEVTLGIELKDDGNLVKKATSGLADPALSED